VVTRYAFRREEMLFWETLRNRLKRVAMGICATTPHALWMDADDFANDAVIVAMEFYDARIGRRELTLDQHSALREEAYRYAKIALKNSFISQIRRHKTHIRALEEKGRALLIGLWSGHMRDNPSPEDHAIAKDLASRIASAAQITESDVYIKIAETISDVAAEGVTNIDTTGLIQLSQTTPNRRRDFACMLTKRLGLSVIGSGRGESL